MVLLGQRGLGRLLIDIRRLSLGLGMRRSLLGILHRQRLAIIRARLLFLFLLRLLLLLFFLLRLRLLLLWRLISHLVLFLIPRLRMRLRLRLRVPVSVSVCVRSRRERRTTTTATAPLLLRHFERGTTRRRCQVRDRGGRRGAEERIALLSSDRAELVRRGRVQWREACGDVVPCGVGVGEG